MIKGLPEVVDVVVSELVEFEPDEFAIGEVAADDAVDVGALVDAVEEVAFVVEFEA